MKVVDFLKRSKQWTQGVEARRADGAVTEARDKEAASWCLLGAITYCYRTDKKMDAAVSKVVSVVGVSVARFNDASTTTFRDIRRVLMEANV